MSATALFRAFLHPTLHTQYEVISTMIIRHRDEHNESFIASLFSFQFVFPVALIQS